MGFGTAFQHSSSCDARGWIQRVAKAEPDAGEGHFFAAMNRHVEHFRIHTPRRETFFYRAATAWRLFPPRLHDVRPFSIAALRRGAFFRQGPTTCDLFLSRHYDVAPFLAEAPRRGALLDSSAETWRLRRLRGRVPKPLAPEKNMVTSSPPTFGADLFRLR
jgi:hypothetical protein